MAVAEPILELQLLSKSGGRSHSEGSIRLLLKGRMSAAR
jgi:hypothetical protein